MPNISDDSLTDSQGNKLSWGQVYNLARGNIYASMSRADLVEAYLESLDNGDLIMWAEDENGEFPKDVAPQL